MILVAINTLGWLFLQLSIAAIATHANSVHFANDNTLYRTHQSEVAFYRRYLHIRRWKRLLPDGAPWVGGSFRKKHLQARDSAYFRQLIVETRRGEAAHWLMLACFPIFFPFNPPWARVVISFYAIAANLPCIVVQRYNRNVAQRILASRSPVQP